MGISPAHLARLETGQRGARRKAFGGGQSRFSAARRGHHRQDRAAHRRRRRGCEAAATQSAPLTPVAVGRRRPTERAATKGITAYRYTWEISPVATNRVGGAACTHQRRAFKKVPGALGTAFGFATTRHPCAVRGASRRFRSRSTTTRNRSAYTPDTPAGASFHRLCRRPSPRSFAERSGTAARTRIRTACAESRWPDRRGRSGSRRLRIGTQSGRRRDAAVRSLERNTQLHAFGNDGESAGGPA